MGKSTGSIPSTYTITDDIGGTGTPLAIDAGLDDIRIKEIAPITVNSNIAVTKPIVSEIKPIKIEPLHISTDSNSRSEVDLKPLAIDSCTTLKIAPLPPIKVEQPYSQHYGITYMGMELWGINISGHSGMFLHSPPKESYFREHVSSGHCHEESEKGEKSSAKPKTGGLRVRVK